MKRYMLWFLVGSFVLGSFLRAWNFWYFPVGGETQDEIAWSLLGSSLLQTGEPVSWSYFSGYESVGELTSTDGGARYPLVAPALDHPPLFSLIPGVTLSLLGKAWNEIPSLKLIRAPMVLLSILNLGLFIFWQLRRKVSENEKAVSTLLFATLPAVVFLSRLVVAENLLVTLILLCFILRTYDFGKWRNFLWFALLWMFPLIKASGLALGVGVIAFLWLERKEKKKNSLWLFASAGFFFGMISWILYAGLYDLSLFWQVQFQQAQRDTGLLTLFSSQMLPSVLVEKVFLDPWLLLSWMVPVFWFMGENGKKDSEDRSVSLLFFTQVAFILLSVGEHTVHGWYRIPLWPLFTVMIARWLTQIWEKKSLFSLAWFLILMSPLVRLIALSVLGSEMFAWQDLLVKIWMVCVGAVVGLSFLTLSARMQNIFWRFAAILVSILFVLGHTLVIMQVNHQRYWEDVLYSEEGHRP